MSTKKNKPKVTKKVGNRSINKVGSSPFLIPLKTLTMEKKDAFLNCVVDKKKLKGAVASFFRSYGGSTVIEMLERLKRLGFQHATKAGSSIGIDDLLTPPTKANLVLNAELDSEWSKIQESLGLVTQPEDFQKGTTLWQKVNETLKQRVIDHFCSTDILNPVYMMAFSGARGNITQVRQLVGMRGLIADPKGELIDFPIKSNFREGLTLTEYLISCFGARKGVVDTALRTATSGYLTRRLVDVSHHIVISHPDCLTKQGIPLKPLSNDEQTFLPFHGRLVGRVLAETINLKDFFIERLDNNQVSFNFVKSQFLKGCKTDKVSKTRLFLKRNQPISSFEATLILKRKNKVLVRSPLTCEAINSVCRLCYGWGLAYGRMVNLGEAVGVLAGQSIGEPGTQLTMRTFHTGGVFSGQFFENVVRTPCSGRVKFSKKMVGSITRTVQGHLAFVIKKPTFIKICPLEGKPVKIRLSTKNLLVVKEGQIVSAGQIVAEFAIFSFSESSEIKFVQVQRDGKVNIFDPFFYHQQNQHSICQLDCPLQLLSGRVVESTKLYLVAPGDRIDSNTSFTNVRVVGRGLSFVSLAFQLKKVNQVLKTESRVARKSVAFKKFRVKTPQSRSFNRIAEWFRLKSKQPVVQFYRKLGQTKKSATLYSKVEGSQTSKPPLTNCLKKGVVQLKHETPILKLVFQKVEYYKFGYLFFGNFYDLKRSNCCKPIQALLRNSLTQSFLSNSYYAKTTPWLQIFCNHTNMVESGGHKWCDFVYFDNRFGWGDFFFMVENWNQTSDHLFQTPLVNTFVKPERKGRLFTKQSAFTYHSCQVRLGCVHTSDKKRNQCQSVLTKTKQKIRRVGTMLVFDHFYQNDQNDWDSFEYKFSKQGGWIKLAGRTAGWIDKIQTKRRVKYNHIRNVNQLPTKKDDYQVRLPAYQHISPTFFRSGHQRRPCLTFFNTNKRVEVSVASWLRLFHPLFLNKSQRHIDQPSSPLPISHQFYWPKKGFRLTGIIEISVITKLNHFLPLWIGTQKIASCFQKNFLSSVLNKRAFFLFCLISNDGKKAGLEISVPFSKSWQPLPAKCLISSSNKKLFTEMALVAKLPSCCLKKDKTQNKRNLSHFTKNILSTSDNFADPKKINDSLFSFKQGWACLVPKEVVFIKNHRTFVRIGQVVPTSNKKTGKQKAERSGVFGNHPVVLEYVHNLSSVVYVCNNKTHSSHLLKFLSGQNNYHDTLSLFQTCFKCVKNWIVQEKVQNPVQTRFLEVLRQVHRLNQCSDFTLIGNKRNLDLTKVIFTTGCRWHPFFDKSQLAVSRIHPISHSFTKSICHTTQVSSSLWLFQKTNNLQSNWLSSQLESLPLIVLARKTDRIPNWPLDFFKQEASMVIPAHGFGFAKQQVSALEDKVCSLCRSLGVQMKSALNPFSEKVKKLKTRSKNLFFGGQLFTTQSLISASQVITPISIYHIRLIYFNFQLAETPFSLLPTVFLYNFDTSVKEKTYIQMEWQSRLAPYRPLRFKPEAALNKFVRFRVKDRGVAFFALSSLSNLPLILVTSSQPNSTFVQINSHTRSSLDKGFFYPKGEVLFVGPSPNNWLVVTQAEQTALSKVRHVDTLFLGQMLRRGQRIGQRLAVAKEGIIVQVERGVAVIHETEAIPRGGQSSLQIGGNQIVQTGDPMITFFTQRYKTEDIVQGIPKIEELFEGRAKAEEQFLDLELNSVAKEYQQHFPDLQSVKKSYRKIQIMVVESIQRVYLSQGVSISDKHLEIVIKQMTLSVSMFNANDQLGKLFPVPVSLVQFTKSFSLGLGIKRHLVRQWFRGRVFSQLVDKKKTSQTGNWWKAIPKKSSVLPKIWIKSTGQKSKSVKLFRKLYRKYERPTFSFSPLMKSVYKINRLKLKRLWKSTQPIGRSFFWKTVFSLKSATLNEKDISKKGATFEEQKVYKIHKVKWVCAPLLMGITQSALFSKSFLAAASFQQTVLVLTRSASIGRNDFLRGIKERGSVGEQMESGTGGVANSLVRNRILPCFYSDSRKIVFDWVSLYVTDERAAAYFQRKIITSLKFLTALEMLKNFVRTSEKKN